MLGRRGRRTVTGHHLDFARTERSGKSRNALQQQEADVPAFLLSVSRKK